MTKKIGLWKRRKCWHTVCCEYLIWKWCQTASEYRKEEGCIHKTQENVTHTLRCQVSVMGLKSKSKTR